MDAETASITKAGGDPHDDEDPTEATNNEEHPPYYDSEAQRPPMPMAPPPLYPLSNDHSLPTPEEAVNTMAFRGLLPTTMPKKRLYLIIGTVVGLTLIIALSAGISASKKNSGGKMSPEERLASTKSFLASASVSSKSALKTKNTPQSLAAEWIAVTDTRQVAIPTSTAYDDSYEFVQRYVLAVLYYATNGQEWSDSSMAQFLKSSSECSWRFSVKAPNPTTGETTLWHIGVSCNDQGQVNQILFPRNNMQGQLPSELNQLQSMEHFSVFENSLTGPLPDLGLWQKLNFFNVDSNKFTGSIGSWFNFPELKYLDLAGNDFTGPLPSFDGSTKLSEAALQYNRFEGSLDAFNGATSLTILYLQNNNLNGELTSETLSDVSLRQFDASNNKLTGSFPAHFYKFHAVDLHNNSLSGELPPITIGGGPLYFLSLFGNQISGSIPDTLGMLYNLMHLDLSSNQLTGELLNIFDKLPKLEYLFLHNNNFDKGPIVDMWKLTSLKEVSLKATNRVGPIPSWVGKDLNNLVLLDLHQNDITGTIPTTLGALTGLRFLFLNDNHLNGTIPAELANMDGLSMLSIQRNDLVGNSDGTVNPVCDQKEMPPYYVSDCKSELKCECCSGCCSDDDPTCFALTTSPSLDGGFNRTHYVFSENLKFSLSTPSSSSSSPAN